MKDKKVNVYRENGTIYFYCRSHKSAMFLDFCNRHLTCSDCFLDKNFSVPGLKNMIPVENCFVDFGKWLILDEK